MKEISKTYNKYDINNFLLLYINQCFIHKGYKYGIEFLINTEFFINYERTFSFFQMVKILNFMGLTYNNLYEKDDLYIKTLYKENSNVLSYYIITLIMINNYNNFLLWCNTNNTELLQFKKTAKNLEKYCKSVSFLHGTQNI